MSNILIQETIQVTANVPTYLESTVQLFVGYYYLIQINSVSYPLRPCAVANNLATIEYDSTEATLYDYTIKQSTSTRRTSFTVNVSGTLNLVVCGPFLSGGDIYITDDSDSGDTDFIGFTFNGVHSSAYNIYATSDGSRYSSSLLPSIKDTTSDKAGNGAYYFGTRYGERNFTISFAFDSMSETDLRGLKIWLGDQSIHPLVFDELPYKVFYAKPSSAPSLNYICFLENDARCYKGEGSISFITYESYAVQPYSVVTTADNKTTYKRYHKILNDYSNSNKSQWAASSGMLTSLIDGSRVIDSYNTTYNYIQLFNAGDVESPLKIYIQPLNVSSRAAAKVVPIEYLQLCNLADDGTTVTGSTRLTFTDEFSLPSADTSLVINSYNRLIEALVYNTTTSKIEKSGEVLNQYIGAGEIFNSPTGKSKIDVGFLVERDSQIYETKIATTVKALNNTTGVWDTLAVGKYAYIAAYTLENGVMYIDCYLSDTAMTSATRDTILSGTRYTFDSNTAQSITITYQAKGDNDYYTPLYNGSTFLSDYKKITDDWSIMPFYYPSLTGYVPILAVEYPFYYL